MKITFSVDCGNAPKMQVIKNFLSGYFHKNLVVLQTLIDEDFVLERVNDQAIFGIDHLGEYIDAMPLVVHAKVFEIMSHGKYGASRGVVETGSLLIHFAFFFEFKSAGKHVIKRVTEYSITQKKHLK